MEDSRRRARETLLKKNPNFYRDIGKMPHPRPFDNPEVAKKARGKVNEVRSKPDTTSGSDRLRGSGIESIPGISSAED